jgi:hypothetical protein
MCYPAIKGNTGCRERIVELRLFESVFFEAEFLALIVFSFILPVGIYFYMMWKRAISRKTVLIFGSILIGISGVDIFLMQRLAVMARNSSSLIDDRIFVSEISVALYLLPVLFAGIGVNLISHVLTNHLTDAERQFDREQR